MLMRTSEGDELHYFQASPRRGGSRTASISTEFSMSVGASDCLGKRAEAQHHPERMATPSAARRRCGLLNEENDAANVRERLCWARIFSERCAEPDRDRI